eukprot:349922-Chlamydomonas_euryale.AAC.4
MHTQSTPHLQQLCAHLRALPRRQDHARVRHRNTDDGNQLFEICVVDLRTGAPAGLGVTVWDYIWMYVRLELGLGQQGLHWDATRAPLGCYKGFTRMQQGLHWDATRAPLICNKGSTGMQQRLHWDATRAPLGCDKGPALGCNPPHGRMTHSDPPASLK